MPKQVVIVAGPNGSGKTTFVNQYVERFCFQYLGADEIAAQLAPDNFNEVKMQAGVNFLSNWLI